MRRRGAGEADRRPPASMSFGMPRFVASRFAVPAGMIATRRLRAREHVDAALHHAVAAPHEDRGRHLRSSAFSTCFGRVLALRHLAPEDVGDAALARARGAAREAAAERLPAVRDHGDARHARLPRRRRARAAPATSPAARIGEHRDRERRDADQHARRRRRSGGACRGTCARAATISGNAIATSTSAISEPASGRASESSSASPT